MSAKKSPIIVDTSAFFAGTKKLRTIIEKGDRLLTIDLIVFEFTKVMEDEIQRSAGSGDTKRAAMLRGLRDRFPKLLLDLGISVTSPEFSSTDVNNLYSVISKGYDSGDAMIWLKMQKAGWDTILTDNVSDWRALGARVMTFD
ncbi:MAG: hypothetical protein JRN09_05255 [Nitrososphaerota archaeon]|nr:hypothetical protein [Nitrososphaerota archaeon]